MQKKLNKGFTIIEVLIVLAIAGVIMLLVLLAVPALQRNSRNTAIKSDAANLAGGINEFVSNNNGKIPSNVSGTGDIAIVNGSLTQTTKIQGGTNVTSGSTAPASGVPVNGSIYVRIGARCDGTVSTRAFAIYYNTETSGSSSQQCLDT